MYLLNGKKKYHAFKEFIIKNYALGKTFRWLDMLTSEVFSLIDNV